MISGEPDEDSKVAPVPMEIEETAPIATDVKEFMDFIVNDDKSEVEKFIKNEGLNGRMKRLMSLVTKAY